MQQLVDRNIGLALCPTSNLLLGVTPTIEQHQLRELWDAGVTFSVNTDDPGFFDCDLTGEYAIAGRLLDLDRPGYAKLARDSVETSFAPEALKEEMRREIDDFEARWPIQETREENLPTFSWEQLERQLVDLAATPAQARDPVAAVTKCSTMILDRGEQLILEP